MGWSPFVRLLRSAGPTIQLVLQTPAMMAALLATVLAMSYLLRAAIFALMDRLTRRSFQVMVAAAGMAQPCIGTLAAKCKAA